MSKVNEFGGLRPRVTWTERIRHFWVLLVLGIGALSLLAMGLAVVMFFAMFFLPSYEYLTDSSFLTPVLAQWLVIIAMVPCIGIVLTGPGPSLQGLFSGLVMAGIIFWSLVMLLYSGSYIATQLRFRDARQVTYVFRIAGEKFCGNSECAELFWEGNAAPKIHIGHFAARAIRESADSRHVPDPAWLGHSESITDYCVRLPVQIAGELARIRVRKFYNFTTADFIACPADAEILRHWPPRRPTALAA